MGFKMEYAIKFKDDDKEYFYRIELFNEAVDFIDYGDIKSFENRQEAEDLVNEKHYQGYRLINVDFDVADNAGYIYAFITMKRPNTY